MPCTVIQPPTYDDSIGPYVFLAGPIQGVSNWQNSAILFLDNSNTRFTIANPRRGDDTWQYQFNIQVDWETHYLDCASKNGVILFWLAKETDHSCERAYAQTTRFELGEWLAKYKARRFDLVLGFEEGFTGERYIRHRMATDKDLKKIPVFSNLNDACKQVLGTLAQQYKVGLQ